MPIKKPSSKYCNARSPNSITGYCRKQPGFGTTHVGTGRCKFHGGSSPGRNVIHGMYSKSLTSNLKKEFDKLVNNTMLVDLSSELALTKGLLSNLLDNIKDNLSDLDRNWWIQSNKFGKEVSAEATALLRVLEAMGKIYKRIVDTEAKSQKTLTPKDVFIIIKQIQININSVCGECPVRTTIANKLSGTKMPNMIEEVQYTTEKERNENES